MTGTCPPLRGHRSRQANHTSDSHASATLGGCATRMHFATGSKAECRLVTIQSAPVHTEMGKTQRAVGLSGNAPHMPNPPPHSNSMGSHACQATPPQLGPMATIGQCEQRL
eukprot:CAMPEP_0174361160 /NCGR_PEP_ID=MMETSP0811_2-20130205/57833_1 /TAXON_ID=73025 ORGANISM="Eutreptiella gymnastica-like, Strain CCMP1594" /NCGR_SAMPLE_ID=MMETSP0811_2 /ASSEMBLY_ACC=CAM_ASM_000667 /LENGTH=110 /DNA_ID=CAMNT_0015497571 /DNA_START=1060 /DNA_END=1392 /DNA_ORIENTATION=+